MAHYRITRLKFFELARFCAERRIALQLTAAGPIAIEGWFEDSAAAQIKEAGFWIDAN